MEHFKSVHDDEFQVKTEKAGPELWIPMGLLAVVAIMLTISSVMSGLMSMADFLIFPVIGIALTASYPAVRKMQRNSNYREYLKGLQPGELQALDDSELDMESRKLARELLDDPTTYRRCAVETNKTEGTSDHGG